MDGKSGDGESESSGEEGGESRECRGESEERKCGRDGRRLTES